MVVAKPDGGSEVGSVDGHRLLGEERPSLQDPT